MSVSHDVTGVSLSISTGGKDVIRNGLVHSFTEEVKFLIQSLTINCTFITDSDGPRFDTTPVSATELSIDFYNFNSNIGMSMTEALRVGSLDGRVLFLFISTSKAKPQENLRKIEYTFYLGEKVDG
ncbi:DUF6864 domain-containing function [Geopsychrobacter electrodiphilus]|uniref:DUF6864 domain-containing function n=1 Tax=Geopsychrobacter electrodiphilus TaxID=225196 RepID=UPI00036926A9|nr:hypothetical protein [Geopsychrobacter electrodiphilus]